MNAKNIFKKVLELSGPLGAPKNYRSFSIYRISQYTDDKIVYRVDCGEAGSYEIIKILTEEIYNTKLHEWIFIPCEHYLFSCLSQNFNGYPLIKPAEAWAILNEKEIQL